MPKAVYHAARSLKRQLDITKDLDRIQQYWGKPLDEIIPEELHPLGIVLSTTEYRRANDRDPLRVTTRIADPKNWTLSLVQSFRSLASETQHDPDLAVSILYSVTEQCWAMGRFRGLHVTDVSEAFAIARHRKCQGLPAQPSPVPNHIGREAHEELLSGTTHNSSHDALANTTDVRQRVSGTVFPTVAADGSSLHGAHPSGGLSELEITASASAPVRATTSPELFVREDSDNQIQQGWTPSADSTTQNLRPFDPTPPADGAANDRLLSIPPTPISRTNPTNLTAENTLNNTEGCDRSATPARSISDVAVDDDTKFEDIDTGPHDMLPVKEEEEEQGEGEYEEEEEDEDEDTSPHTPKPGTTPPVEQDLMILQAELRLAKIKYRRVRLRNAPENELLEADQLVAELELQLLKMGKHRTPAYAHLPLSPSPTFSPPSTLRGQKTCE
ncbi:hypothetical protein M8818_000022 [Zalaria obscura]|uniref:Uncharacterized protein n=1 Tax=Zalaria obscura TaxID=2024903 RepID=A0ACC3SQT8_9PEZI